jgi:flagellar motility protein MotE (MotC chaperone)
MNIIKWVVLSIGGLAFLIAVVFSVMLLISPPAPVAEPDKPLVSKKDIQNAKQNKSEKRRVDKLVLKVVELDSTLKVKNATIDSLQIIAAEAGELRKQVEKLQTQLTGSLDKNARAKDIAKTLSSMKSKAMAPILNKLDDETVMLIYNQTSKTSRSTILAALSEERAAKITSKLINQ